MDSVPYTFSDLFVDRESANRLGLSVIPDARFDDHMNQTLIDLEIDFLVGIDR